MYTIFWMSTLKHTCISFPSKIIVVNIWNSFISFIRWDMCLMKIYPVWVGNWPFKSFWLFIHFTLLLSFLFWKLAGLHIWCQLQISYVWKSNKFIGRTYVNLILIRDHGNFNRWTRLKHNCVLHVVMSLLNTVKTLYLLIGHCKSLVSNRWSCLHKSNHSFITKWIKLGIISFWNLVELLNAILHWINRYTWFYGIHKICNEP